MPEEPVIRDRRRVPRVFLILSALVLLAALLVGGSYLLWKLDVAELPFYDKLAAAKDAKPADPTPTDAPASQTDAAPTKPHEGDAVPCKGITLDQTEILFTESDGQTQLVAVPTPSDTTDSTVFSSSDLSVVKVSPVGIVTAVGPGTAVITVSCGKYSAECAVSCEFEDNGPSSVPIEVTELTLVKDDMTFKAAGENFVLSVTNVPAGTPVEWKSLDESICTVDAGGHVTAVGPGTTRVIATVGNLSAECWVRCRFE